MVRFIALRMLLGDRARYLGIVMGLTFASLLITQQTAIYTGLMARTYGAITDVGLADIWVMDPEVLYIDDIKALRDTVLDRVRGVPGVEWAVPLYKGLLKGKTGDGRVLTLNVVGLDDATLIGGPPRMVEGELGDLRRPDAVIVDIVGATGQLARPSPEPGGKPVPLAIGDTLEINDRRAVVVGLCEVSRTFQWQPVVYTTWSRARAFAPPERKLLSYVLVRSLPAEDPAALCDRIGRLTGLAAETREEFQERTRAYFFQQTGIPINFGIAVLLGFFIGTAIAGQTFYNFTLDNLRHFGTLRAMGTGSGALIRMVLLQALVAGGVGYGLGVGLAALFGLLTRGTELAFLLPGRLLLQSAAAILLICLLAAAASVRRVLRAEPALVFRA